MKTIRRALSTSLAAAVIGGLLVSLLGWAAFAAGLVAGAGGPSSTQTTATASSPQQRPVPVAERSSGALSAASIYRRDGAGVVYVEARQRSPFGGGQTATGSGFVLDRAGHILTNAHVIDGASEVAVKLGPNSQPLRARVVGKDNSTDVAVLDVKAPARRLHPLPLGDSGAVRVGDSVIAIGNPYGLDRTETSGIVSALQRQIKAPNGVAINGAIQTDAAINPGNSGGPLIDAAGQVIGITSQIATSASGGGNTGIGFAIPIDTARQVADGVLGNAGAAQA